MSHTAPLMDCSLQSTNDLLEDVQLEKHDHVSSDHALCLVFAHTVYLVNHNNNNIKLETSTSQTSICNHPSNAHPTYIIEGNQSSPMLQLKIIIVICESEPNRLFDHWKDL